MMWNRFTNLRKYCGMLYLTIFGYNIESLQVNICKHITNLFLNVPFGSQNSKSYTPRQHTTGHLYDWDGY